MNAPPWSLRPLATSTSTAAPAEVDVALMIENLDDWTARLTDARTRLLEDRDKRRQDAERQRESLALQAERRRLAIHERLHQLDERELLEALATSKPSGGRPS